MKRGQPLRRIFAIPTAIGLLSLIGLVSALTGDGWRDTLSCATLSIPIIAIGWAMSKRSS